MDQLLLFMSNLSEPFVTRLSQCARYADVLLIPLNNELLNLSVGLPCVAENLQSLQINRKPRAHSPSFFVRMHPS